MRHHPFLSKTLFVLSIAVTGCGPGSSEHAAKGSQDPVPVSDGQDRIPGPVLELDNGERWVVSPPMLVPIRRMQRRITKAVQPGDPAIQDHAALVDSLFMDLDDLVAGCTMEGKAHEELHDWLMPHMQLVQDLEKAADTTQVRVILHQLATSCAEFDRYFQ